MSYKYHCNRCGSFLYRGFKKRWFKSMCGDEAIVRVWLVTTILDGDVASLRSRLSEAYRALRFADKLLVAHDNGHTAVMDLDDMEKYKAIVFKAKKGTK